ncbi:hypothetical protein ACFX2A_038310 [Malus domestica]
MTCIAMPLLELASKSKDSEYFLWLSSLGALSEARVITGSNLGCSCAFGGVDEGAKEAAERAFALFRVMMPEVMPPAVMTLLFLASAAGTTWAFFDAICACCGFTDRDEK